MFGHRRRNPRTSQRKRKQIKPREEERGSVMASTVASKRVVPLVRALEKLLAAPSAPFAGSALRPVAVAGGLRGYNTGAPLRRYEGAESDEDGVREYENCRGGRDYAVPSLFSDVFRDPFSAPQSLGRLLSLMDDMATASPVRAGAVRRGWNAREDEEALHLRVDMPGLGKEHVKVWAEQNSLVIKGEGEKEAGEDEAAPPPRYTGRIELSPEVYRMDTIKAEMKNGVLKVVVPKVKEQQRKDVFQVNVE
uniref:SHSP domain-containing protein n=3 Tax=Setaria TaxID=4554 RepID=K3YV91_SETIT